MVIQRNASLSIKDGRMVVSVKISGDEFILGICKNALERTVGGFLDSSLDSLVWGGFLEADSKINNGDVLGGDTHGHSSELAIQFRNDLADSLSGTSAAGDDVGSSGTPTTPVLSGRAVNGLLGSGVRVNSGHQPLDDAEFVVQDLGKGSQAVGGARGVGKDVNILVIFLEVYTADEHGSISGRSRAIKAIN